MKLKTKQAKTPMAQVKSLILSLFNTKTSGKKKLMAAGIILYIISPIDFVPDFIPVVGYADDVILPILFLVANKLLSDDTQMNSTQVRKEAEKV
ncbi:YkvA family protein [Carnobacterium alterfunditum]|uniref:YkvA family protein n=1 Tax=Carnobacterium alterfunditum TaxID=28230 RepID=UPI003594738D